uniref:Uncharacterized protein n=1 Tax=Glossina pallidipes TaxID=7398 RepID=A0A1A9ZN59_GLOPL
MNYATLKRALNWEPINQEFQELFIMMYNQLKILLNDLGNNHAAAFHISKYKIITALFKSNKDHDCDNHHTTTMTAEKTLNIVEVQAKDLKLFLMKKQMEGYKIVGAEQTCNIDLIDPPITFPEEVGLRRQRLKYESMLSGTAVCLAWKTSHKIRRWKCKRKRLKFNTWIFPLNGKKYNTPQL